MYSCVSLILFGLFAQEIRGEIPSENTSEGAFFSYNTESSYAAFEAWRIPGELSFLFKTNKPTAILAYQGDGNYKYFDLFLVQGKLRARARFNTCRLRQLIVDGNFSDSLWHRVRLTRGNEEVTLTVDGCKTESSPCQFAASVSQDWKILYVGNIPLHTISLDLANPQSGVELIEFQGCIGHVTQTTPEHSPKPLALLHSNLTGANCQSQCSSGGKCDPIADVTMKECECPGYGNRAVTCRRYLALPKANFSDSAKVSASPLSPSTSLGFSSKITPTVLSKGEMIMKATSSSEISWRSSITRFLSATTHARETPKVEGQHADKAVVRHSHSVPGLFNRSQHLVTTHSSSLPPTVLFPSSAGVPLGSSVNDNTSAVMAKKNSALRSLGSWVFVYFAVTTSIANTLINL